MHMKASMNKSILDKTSYLQLLHFMTFYNNSKNRLEDAWHLKLKGSTRAEIEYSKLNKSIETASYINFKQQIKLN